MRRIGTIQYPIIGATLAALLAFAAPAAAQREEGSQRGRGDQRGDRPEAQRRQRRQRADQDRTARNQRRRDGDMQGRRGMGRPQVEPLGWVRIATDYDNDGRFDAVETIYYVDLEQAKRSSSERMRSGRGPRGERRRRVQGKIVDMRTETFAGLEGEQQLARIETEQGRTAKVNLGPVDQLSELDLREDDTVTVAGARGMINDRPVLMVDRIEAGDRTVRIDRPGDRRQRRVRARVLGTREERFRGRGEHLVAEVRTGSGRRRTVVMGPASKYQGVQINEGDEVRLMVRPGRLDGEPALVAEQARIGDRTVTLDPPPRRRDAGEDRGRNASGDRDSGPRGKPGGGSD